MCPEKVQQNRELLYKFHLPDDRHGGMNSVLVEVEHMMLNVITA
jgi:hypothetical protein